MPTKLSHKPCRQCGRPIAGIMRLDKKCFRYPRRCTECRSAGYTPEGLASKRAAMRSYWADKELLPIGTTRLHDSGRGKIYREAKMAQPNTWQYEHRLIMEQALGRKLERSEHVHHINGDTLDNQLGNLTVLHVTAHNRLHDSLHNQLNGRWSLKHDRCIVCHSTERRHEGKGQCTACFQRTRYALGLSHYHRHR
jgi:HNH endonuclease